MSGPLFSVIIPTYNRVRLVTRAIQSVLEQSCPDFELLVVDDGSTDDTATVVRRFTDPRVRYLRQDNQGVSVARNAGARAAKGQYLTFLDSDDFARSNWLEQFAAVHAEQPFAVAYCGTSYVDADLRPLSEWLPRDMGPLFMHEVVHSLPGGYVIDRRVFDAVGGYDPAIGCNANSELIMRLVRHCRARTLRTATIMEPLVTMEHRGARSIDAWQLQDAEPFIESYGHEFHRYPESWAGWLTVWGVSACRLHHFDTARRYFRLAIQLTRSDVGTRARLCLTYVPVLREQLWRPRSWAVEERIRRLVRKRRGSMSAVEASRS